MTFFTALALNPGSTTTRAALLRQDGGPTPGAPQCLWSTEVQHSREDLQHCTRVTDQLDLRREAIREALKGAGLDGAPGNGTPDIVTGRGGLLAPLPGGVYAVNDIMLGDLASARYGEHACNLGAPLAKAFADQWGVPACITDPVVTDELNEVARLTGLPEVRRRTIFHALSQRGAARTAAARLGLRYEEGRFIVAHLGGGVSIGAHDRGRVVEVNNALDGEGPFSPERAGNLPMLPLLEMIERGQTSVAELRERILRHGGLLAHLGTNDLRQAEAMAETDSRAAPNAALVLEALVYNISRHIGSMGPVLLAGNDATVNAIVLTGGMARSDKLCAAIEARVAYLGPVVRVTGLEEMETLALGGLRVLHGQAEMQEYLGAAAK